MKKSATQIFLENAAQSALSVLKIIILSRFIIRLPKSSAPDCVILGNGPTLNEFIENHLEFLEGKMGFAVNNFARTEAYLLTKPHYYVITSPEHFIPDKIKEWHKDRMKTFDLMAERTAWPMTLFVPVLARKREEWQTILKRNPNIKICYFNNTPVEGFKKLRNFCFAKNLGVPRPHNVLIPSLILGINLGFQKIYIAGADHSWTKEIFVTENNEVLLSQKHFYDSETLKEETDKNKPTPKPMYLGGTGETRKLHEVLLKFYYSFRSYWDIKDYAEACQVSIYNITPGSFIDAFEKQRI